MTWQQQLCLSEENQNVSDTDASCTGQRQSRRHALLCVLQSCVEVWLRAQDRLRGLYAGLAVDH